MKKFRISYTICEGGNEYADEMIVESRRGGLTRRQAAGHVWEYFTCDPEDRDDRQAFVSAIKDGGFSMIAGDYRGIKGLCFEETSPCSSKSAAGRCSRPRGSPAMSPSWCATMTATTRAGAAATPSGRAERRRERCSPPLRLAAALPFFVFRSGSGKNKGSAVRAGSPFRNALSAPHIGSAGQRKGEK